MSETSIFIFGCFVFGLSLAGTMVLTIGTSHDRVEDADQSLAAEAPQSLSTLNRSS